MNFEVVAQGPHFTKKHRVIDGGMLCDEAGVSSGGQPPQLTTGVVSLRIAILTCLFNTRTGKSTSAREFRGVVTEVSFNHYSDRFVANGVSNIFELRAGGA